MRLDAVRLLVAFCVTPCATDIWLEGPPLKQPGPRAAAPAPKGPASPPESDHAAFVRPPAPHEAWDVAGREADDEGGVTSLSAAAAHAGAEPGGWRGAIKAVSGRNLGKVAKLVEKGVQEELAEAQAEVDDKLTAPGRTRAAAQRGRRGRVDPNGAQRRDGRTAHGEQVSRTVRTRARSQSNNVVSE